MAATATVVLERLDVLGDIRYPRVALTPIIRPIRAGAKAFQLTVWMRYARLISSCRHWSPWEHPNLKGEPDEESCGRLRSRR